MRDRSENKKHTRCDDCKNMTTALKVEDGKHRCNRCHYNYTTEKLIHQWGLPA